MKVLDRRPREGSNQQPSPAVIPLKHNHGQNGKISLKVQWWR